MSIACVEHTGRWIGHSPFPALHLAGQLRQQLPFFNFAQVRARRSTGLVMARYQDMLAGVVIFSLDGLW